MHNIRNRAPGGKFFMSLLLLQKCCIEYLGLQPPFLQKKKSQTLFVPMMVILHCRYLLYYRFYTKILLLKIIFDQLFISLNLNDNELSTKNSLILNIAIFNKKKILILHFYYVLRPGRRQSSPTHRNVLQSWPRGLPQ